MAYSKGLWTECVEDGCHAEARRAVFTSDNGHVGDFCRPHADKKVAELKRYEARGENGPEDRTGASGDYRRA